MNKGELTEDALFFAALHISGGEERNDLLDIVCRDKLAMRGKIEELVAL